MNRLEKIVIILWTVLLVIIAITRLQLNRHSQRIMELQRSVLALQQIEFRRQYPAYRNVPNDSLSSIAARIATLRVGEFEKEDEDTVLTRRVP